ncbi:P-loop containing nucleoside triphosphate hydrolase [Pseudocohnilembus persalinus]|uniref:p-loop containing nucleoside triphosphate hydrolase n=1 Tax=Pseudocohnilembus persalinus TaxID=266149 RepID=A0A0V0R717_PSEPJ|nr:P-loop containing nucleoside triphosphate hydrolase [Pseudocohnilembus persalinus]|eukprot:KRX10287.1 P-loop containing nucleoside triphosphate hydrolase [Pseudocohnilembus persalinus]
MEEPVLNWQAINNNPKLNLLDEFYKNPTRWAYTFQMKAFQSRLESLQLFLKQNQSINNQIILSERCIFSDKEIFAKNSKDLGFLNDIEWALYQENFNFMIKQLKLFPFQSIGHIYLQTQPELAYQRIKKRNRTEENTISIDYLESLYNRHESWLNKNKCQNLLIIDASQDFLNNQEAFDKSCMQIDKFIKEI